MLKSVFAPHLGRNVVLGACKLTSHKDVALLPRLRTYLRNAPASPGSVAWNGPAMAVISDVEGNDTLGDCVCAEEAHYIGLVTGNAGKLFTYSSAMTIAMYSALTGYNPNDPSTDQGTDPIACLDYFLKDAYADGSKNAGYLLVDATNQAEIQYAIATFGNLKIWLALPDSYVNPFPSGNGFVWDVGAPDPSNGHCIGSCGYIENAPPPDSVKVLGISANGVIVMTWGLVGTMTWAALAQLCVPAAGGGLAVRVTPDWINANGKTPTGLSMAQLIADFDLIGGTLPIPAPAPPAPTPVPTGGVTLAQAQGWATQGIAGKRWVMTRQEAEKAASDSLARNWPK
jgi:hypothetical protein